jgi:hypothetical protein
LDFIGLTLSWEIESQIEDVNEVGDVKLSKISLTEDSKENLSRCVGENPVFIFAQVKETNV